MSVRATRVTHSVRTNGRLMAAAIMIVLLGMIGTRSLGYLAFVAIALMPTFAAALLEKTGQRSATISIGSMTAATLMPLVMGAIANGSSRDLLTSSQAWLFVAGAVLGGAAIYFAMPAATVVLEAMRARARLRELRDRQALLEQHWGPEVRSQTPG